MVTKANETQVAGTHYKTGGEEHWDRVARLGLDYFQAQITKYVERAWKKNGVQDLKKASHFLQKYIELHEAPPEVGRIDWKDGSWTFTPATLQLGALTDPRSVYPTGWIGFVFEGADQGGFLFTCKRCAAKFYAEPETDPNAAHSCAGPEYVAQ